MMRSLFSGVAGLKNHQIRMDVIGNNISNVNTTGFKSERVTFQDIISQTLQGATEPQENIGGVNPKQVGLGMKIASIDKLMTQGSLQTTDKNTDLAITGEGFFILKDGDKSLYTRAGAFDVDKNGLLVNPANGLKVQGWNAVPSEIGKNEIITSSDIEDVVIPLYSKQKARETSFVQLRSNLNSATQTIPQNATPEEIRQMISHPDHRMRRGHITSIKVYDNQGVQRTLNVSLWKKDTNTWQGTATIDGVEQLTVDVAGQGNLNTNKVGNNEFSIRFTPDGKIASISDGTDEANQGELGVQLQFRLPNNPAVRSLELRLGQAGTVNGITQFASPFTTKAVEQDGNTMGYLESFIIDSNGTVTGTYSNGVQQALAKVALANFTNPEGLTKAGQSSYTESINSGVAQVGESGLAGLGSLNAGFLEMSNVDLADSFTDMIVTQRGFQANSRSITTSDQMLQELLTLKR